MTESPRRPLDSAIPRASRPSATDDSRDGVSDASDIIAPPATRKRIRRSVVDPPPPDPAALVRMEAALFLHPRLALTSSACDDTVIAGSKRKRRSKATSNEKLSDNDYSIGDPRGGTRWGPAASIATNSDEGTDSAVDFSTLRRGGRGRGRGRGLGRPRGSRGRGRVRGRGGRSSILVAIRNLPRSSAADRCFDLLAADTNPFITERSRLRQGAVALQTELDALGNDDTSATHRAELQWLIARLEP